MHIQSRMFNFLFKLKSSTEFDDGFYCTKDLEGWDSTRSFYREMLEVTPNQYGIFVWRVGMYLLAWRSFSKLGSSIECSLKSFPSDLKLDNLVVIIHDVIYIFKLQLLMNIVSTYSSKDENPWS
jgi:hypothetical protein